MWGVGGEVRRLRRRVRRLKYWVLRLILLLLFLWLTGRFTGYHLDDPFGLLAWLEPYQVELLTWWPVGLVVVLVVFWRDVKRVVWRMIKRYVWRVVLFD